MKNDNVKLVGICGPARAGKDTLARKMTQVLVDTRNEHYQDYVIAMESFAAPVKSMIAMLLDFFGYGSIMNPSSLEKYLEGDSKEEVLVDIGKSTRQMMQTLGTDWGRKMVNDDIWLNSMKERINHYGEAVKHGHTGAFVFITDVRFDNEAELIKELGGTIVRVDSDRIVDAVEAHASEAGVSDCLVDTHIQNNGDTMELEFIATSYLESLLDTKLGEGAPRLDELITLENGEPSDVIKD